jgi:hypothetical protein
LWLLALDAANFHEDKARVSDRSHFSNMTERTYNSINQINGTLTDIKTNRPKREARKLFHCKSSPYALFVPAKAPNSGVVHCQIFVDPTHRFELKHTFRRLTCFLHDCIFHALIACVQRIADAKAFRLLSLLIYTPQNAS